MVAARMLRTSPVNARGAQGGVAAEIKAAVKQALDANKPQPDTFRRTQEQAHRQVWRLSQHRVGAGSVTVRKFFFDCEIYRRTIFRHSN